MKERVKAEGIKGVGKEKGKMDRETPSARSLSKCLKHSGLVWAEARSQELNPGISQSQLLQPLPLLSRVCSVESQLRITPRYFNRRRAHLDWYFNHKAKHLLNY